MDLHNLLDFVHRLASLKTMLREVHQNQREQRELSMKAAEALAQLQQQAAANTAATTAATAAEVASTTALHGLIDEVHQLATAAQASGETIDPQALLDLTAELRDAVPPLATATADAVAATTAAGAVIADPNAPGADPTGGLGQQGSPQIVSPAPAEVGAAAVGQGEVATTPGGEVLTGAGNGVPGGGDAQVTQNAPPPVGVRTEVSG